MGFLYCKIPIFIERGIKWLFNFYIRNSKVFNPDMMKHVIFLNLVQDYNGQNQPGSVKCETESAKGRR